MYKLLPISSSSYRKEVKHYRAPLEIPIRSRQRQDGPQELEIVYRCQTILVGVEILERVAHLLQNHARTHEAIEREARWGPLVGTPDRCLHVVFASQDFEQLRGDCVAVVGQSALQLRIIDGAGSIAIEMGEDTLPILYELPQAGELIETDLTTLILVEGIHEKVDGVEIKGGQISVYQRGLELTCIDIARLVLVNPVEQVPEKGISTAGRRAGCVL